MKKNRLFLIIAAALIVCCVVIVLFQRGVFRFSGEEGIDSKAFAIEDTSRVTQIFIADMHENTVLLRKIDGVWMLHDTIPAMQYYVHSVLGTLQNLMVRQNVPQNSIETVNKMLAVGSTKVEIYEMAPKFTLFGIDFFVKERKTKTYYFGAATQDNMASYAYIEGMDEPYIVHVPGFRGFVTPQFSQFENDWRSHTLFSTKITRIKSVVFKDLDDETESFSVQKSGARSFELYNFKNEPILHYDTTKLLDMMSEFRSKNYQTLVTIMAEEERDSIKAHNLFRIITLTDEDDRVFELKLYRMPQDELVNEAELDHVAQVEYEFNRDNFYATLSGKPGEFYLCQYFHFERQMQPASYFLK